MLDEKAQRGRGPVRTDAQCNSPKRREAQPVAHMGRGHRATTGIDGLEMSQRLRTGMVRAADRSIRAHTYRPLFHRQGLYRLNGNGFHNLCEIIAVGGDWAGCHTASRFECCVYGDNGPVKVKDSSLTRRNPLKSHPKGQSHTAPCWDAVWHRVFSFGNSRIQPWGFLQSMDVPLFGFVGLGWEVVTVVGVGQGDM